VQLLSSLIIIVACDPKVKSMKNIIASFAIYLVFASSVTGAEIVSYVIKHPVYNIKVSQIFLDGEIVDGDYEKYLRVYQNVNSQNVVVSQLNLESGGGLVDDGLKIGRHVRRHAISTNIERHKNCFSSCALIFLAGIVAVNGGKLGVHRSYLKSGSKLSFSQMEKTLSENHSEVTDYLRELRLPEKIIQNFLNTSSADMTLIKKILRYDSLYEEYLISNCGVSPEVDFSTTGKEANRKLRFKYYECTYYAQNRAQKEAQGIK